MKSPCNSLAKGKVISVERINDKIAKRLAYAGDVIKAKTEKILPKQKVQIIDVVRTRKVIGRAVDKAEKVFSENGLVPELYKAGLALVRRLAERIVGENIFVQRQKLVEAGLVEDQSAADADWKFACDFAWLFNNESILKHIDQALKSGEDKSFEILKPLRERLQE